MTLKAKKFSRFCHRGTMALGTILLAAFSTTARSQAQLASNSAEYSLNVGAANPGVSSSSSSLPSAPEPAGSPQYGGNQPGNGQYPHHYGDRPKPGKWAFEAGGGFNAPIGNDTPFITWGGNFTVGAGRNLTRNIAALLEYQFIDSKLTGAYVAAVGTPGGHIHVWSLTIDPVLSLPTKGSWGAYATGGGGFYRAVTSFTTPVEQCDIFYGCIVTSETLGHYSSNQGGLNFGGGFTYKIFGPDSNARLFGEARYVWVDGPKATSTTAGIGTIGLVPVTFGVRF
jgi:hypothetical protein